MMNLYQSRQINDDYLHVSEVEFDRKLNVKEKSFCDEILTLHEGEEAVVNLKDNKSPGIDGIPDS